SLEVGEKIDVMNPQGAFTSRTHVTSLNDAQKVAAEKVAEKKDTHLVAFAAGSGITPIMAIAKAVLAASETSRFDLVYAN
ncbi:hypothetical protein QP341_26695, partial [Escherichia coli]|nr:hypothetical protein [Escherichia coli]